MQFAAGVVVGAIISIIAVIVGKHKPHPDSMDYIPVKTEHEKTQPGLKEMPLVRVPSAKFGPIEKRPMAQIIKKEVDPIEEILKFPDEI